MPSVIKRATDNWTGGYSPATSKAPVQVPAPAGSPSPSVPPQVAQHATQQSGPAPGSNGSTEDPKWWDIPQHVSNLLEPSVGFVQTHGGERVTNWLTEGGGDSTIGKGLFWLTSPLTVPAAVGLQALKVTGSAFGYAARAGSTALQATTMDNPLYRDGITLDDLGTMWEASESMGLGRSWGFNLGSYNRVATSLSDGQGWFGDPNAQADYSAWNVIFDVGFNPYSMTDQQRQELNDNAVYGIGTGLADAGFQVALAVAGNKGAAVAKRASGLSTTIRDANDLAALGRDLADPLTPTYNMAQELVTTSDIGRIQANHLVEKSTNIDRVSQMIANVSDINDVRLIVMADRGDRFAIAKLMADAPRHIFQLSDAGALLQEQLTRAVPAVANPARERFLQSAFDDAVNRDAFYRNALDSFLQPTDEMASAWSGSYNGIRRGNTSMPRGTTGLPGVGRIGDVAGRMQLSGANMRRGIMEGRGVGESLLDDSHNWAVRTLGKVGTGAPVTKTLQWLGGRKPIGMVSLSGLRPRDAIDEMKAWVDTARWTHGRTEFQVLRDGQAITTNGVAYRVELVNRLTAAQAKGPSQLAAEVRAVEAEMLSSIGLKHAAKFEDVDTIVKGIQRRRDGDIADIQSNGYYYDEQAARVMVDPLYQRQLADNIHLMPLATVEREMQPAWALSHTTHKLDVGYSAIQKVWRTGILFKPAYTLKNSVAEPLVASLLAHGTVMAPDGIGTVTHHVMVNAGRRTMAVVTSAYDLGAGAIAHVPLARRLVNETYAGRIVEMNRLLKEKQRQAGILDALDAEVKAGAEKSPAWQARYGQYVRDQRDLAEQALRNITERLDSMHLLENMPDHDGIHTPMTGPQLQSAHDQLDYALREDPAVASARLHAEADAIETRGAARAQAADQVEARRVAEAREWARSTGHNVTSVQVRRGEAYVKNLQDTLLRRKDRLARLEQNQPPEFRRARRATQPDQGSYRGGMERLRSAYPMGRGEGIVDQARAEVAALEAHLETALDRLAILREHGGDSAAARRWNEMLDQEPAMTPATRHLTDGEENQVARLRAQADRVASLTPEERAVLQGLLDDAARALEELRTAQNTPGVGTAGSREAAEKALEAAEEKLTNLSRLTAAQKRSRQRYRERVLTGTKGVVYQVNPDGSTTRLRYNRRGEANRIEAQWRANRIAAATGREQDVVPLPDGFVVHPGLFDDVADGAGYRADYAATVTQRAAYDPAGYGDAIAGKIRRGGGTDEIAPGDPHYWSELAYWVNRQVRGDAAGRRILAGENPLALRDWMQTPEGRAYAQKMGWTDGNAAQEMALTQARIIDQYLPQNAVLSDAMRARLKRRERIDLPEGATVRDLAAIREVSEHELEQAMSGLDNLSPVHSGHAVYEPASALQRAGEVQDAIWRTLATHPEERVGRFPGGQLYFNKHMQADIEFMQSQGIEMTADQINALRRGAATRALADVEKTYYNIRRYSNPVYAMRYLTAFPGAFYNSLYRLAHLSLMNPGTAGYMADRFTNAFTSFGVDRDGNKTDDFTKVSALVFDVPSYLKGALPEQDRIAIGLQSLDFLKPSPSFNWTVTVPVDSVLAQRPELDTWMRENLDPQTYNALFPFGEPTSKARYTAGPIVYDNLIPSHIKELQSLFGEEDDARFATTVRQYWQAMAVDYERNGRQGPAPTLKDAEARAKAHWQAEFTLKFGVFGGLQLRADGDMERVAWQQIRDAHGNDYAAAVDEFTRKFGPEAIWFTKSTTQAAGGVPATLDAWQRMKGNEDLVRDIMAISPDDPTVLKALFADTDNAAEFDQAVFNAESHTKIPGTQIPIGGDRPGAGTLSWKAAQEANLSWTEYMKAKAKKDALMVKYGYSSLQSKEAAWLHDQWNTWLDEFANAPENQAWRTEYAQRDYGKADRTLRALDAIAQSPLMKQQADNPYFKAIADYLDNYAIAADAFAKADTAARRNHVKEAWATYVTKEIAPKSKQFADLYDRYLDGNDLAGVT